jgi:small conductance mechanosensitive channel
MNEVEQMNKFMDVAIELSIGYGPRLVLALITLLVGLWVIRAVTSGVTHAFETSGMELTLRNFLRSLINIGLKALLLISVASMVGIETTSFIAVLGAAGLAIGLALQGSLANFAGGVLLLVFRPYKVGDYIEAAGYMGSVRSIEIFSTVLTTSDNKTIIIPNGAVSNGAITNFSTQSTRRVDMVFGIGYEDDLREAKQVLSDLVAADDRILAEPLPLIVVSKLGESAVDISVKTWVNAADYWGVYYDMNENVKLGFDGKGISIPYPQSDVHLHQVAPLE